MPFNYNGYPPELKCPFHTNIALRIVEVARGNEETQQFFGTEERALCPECFPWVKEVPSRRAYNYQGAA